MYKVENTFEYMIVVYSKEAVSRTEASEIFEESGLSVSAFCNSLVELFPLSST